MRKLFTNGGFMSFYQKLKTSLEMIKFEHSLFALPFAYLGLFLGEKGWPSGFLLAWVTVAMVSFRTMSMTINRIVDSAIDSKNPRTKNRALPAGKLSFQFAWGLSLISFALFILSCHQLGELCLKLAWIPTVLAILYSYCKRFTWAAHFVLGIVLGLAPYGAWVASTGELSWIAGWLMIGVSCWVAGFDLFYSLQDMEFDKGAGLYSFPAKFGQSASIRLAALLHLVAVVAWFLAGWLAQLGWFYWVGWFLVLCFLIYENRLVQKEGMKKIDQAFFSVNAYVSVALFVAVLGDLVIRRIG